jgi:hypothetical protein
MAMQYYRAQCQQPVLLRSVTLVGFEGEFQVPVYSSDNFETVVQRAMWMGQFPEGMIAALRQHLTAELSA